ncbi:hypothetical protein [Actinomadura craniellae]|nr:hypothetical protein [Actinomadura craniellae]
MEAAGGGRLIVDPTKRDALHVRYDQIGPDALSRNATRKLITQLMEVTS